MFDESVMGFDCREMWLLESEITNLNRDNLLNSDVEKVLSIDRNTWKSVFLHPLQTPMRETNQTAPGYSLKIPVEEATYNGFWQDFTVMKDFMVHHSEEYEKRCMMISITVLQTPEYVQAQEKEGLSVPPVLNKQPDSQWTLLGYDVEDSFSFNLGLGTTFPDELQLERKNLWGSRLNRYYLFSDQEDAINYANWHINIHPGVGILLVFGIYLIEEIP